MKPPLTGTSALGCVLLASLGVLLLGTGPALGQQKGQIMANQPQGQAANWLMAQNWLLQEQTRFAQQQNWLGELMLVAQQEQIELAEMIDDLLQAMRRLDGMNGGGPGRGIFLAGGIHIGQHIHGGPGGKEGRFGGGRVLAAAGREQGGKGMKGGRKKANQVGGGNKDGKGPGGCMGGQQRETGNGGKNGFSRGAGRIGSPMRNAGNRGGTAINIDIEIDIQLGGCGGQTGALAGKDANARRGSPGRGKSSTGGGRQHGGKGGECQCACKGGGEGAKQAGSGKGGSRGGKQASQKNAPRDSRTAAAGKSGSQSARNKQFAASVARADRLTGGRMGGGPGFKSMKSGGQAIGGAINKTVSRQNAGGKMGKGTAGAVMQMAAMQKGGIQGGALKGSIAPKPAAPKGGMVHKGNAPRAGMFVGTKLGQGGGGNKSGRPAGQPVHGKPR